MAQSSQNESRTAYLIDASIYIFQAHFSPYIECYDKKGEDLSALYGFSQFLLQFMQRERPQILAVGMDNSLFCGFRHELCNNYKSNRELPDKNLERQLAACGELCEVLGLARFTSRTYEADDIIGTLARRIREQHQVQGRVDSPRIGILTRDKDLAQVLRTNSEFVWDYQKNQKRYIKDIIQDFGVRPDQIPDYLGLVGDSVDKISGVPGIGPVKGKHLLLKFGDMDGIYCNLEKLAELRLRGSANLAQTLSSNKELAYLSKKLATIVDDVASEDEPFSSVGLGVLERTPADLDGLFRLLSRERFDTRFCEIMVRAVEKLNNTMTEVTATHD